MSEDVEEGELPYSYYVVFKWSNGSSNGSGSMNLLRDRPIDSYEEAQSAKQYITEHNGFESVVLLNWILFPPSPSKGDEE